MTTLGTIIVFQLSIRICGALVNQTCHWEKTADFSSEPVCRASGALMLMYPGVAGFKCKLETREYQYRTGVGNAF